jgi:hypothetical protein
MIVAVDFDDTICTNTNYPDVGAPVPMALDYLLQFDEAGARLILWTVRSEDALDAAADYLRTAGVPIWGYNNNPEQYTWNNSPKVYAHLYIDDAGFGVPLTTFAGVEVVDWAKVGPAVLSKIHTYDPTANPYHTITG